MTLGDAATQSALGEKLRVTIPVSMNAGDQLAAECLRLVPSARRSDPMPTLDNGRVAIERLGAETALVVTSARAITEPMLRMAVQTSCDRSMLREYVVLVDPAPAVAPIAPSLAAVPATEFTPPAIRPSVVAAPEITLAVASNKAVVATALEQSPEPVRFSTDTTRLVTTKVAAAAPSRASLAETKPRDDVAQMLTAANALEAETLMLRERIAQQSSQIDKLKNEGHAADAAPRVVAASAPVPVPFPPVAPATPIAVARPITPHAALGGWWTGSWPIVAAAVGLAALIGAGFGWKRRRAAQPATTLWPITDTLPLKIEPALEPTSFTTSESSDAGGLTISSIDESQPAPTAQNVVPLHKPAEPRKTPAANAPVAVSELSHVTEEAGVYLAFQRVDRAIEVLREHIRTEPRSLPSSWLMLLDIYRSNGRELEFRALAQEFHQQFNVQPPKWDGSTEKEEAGLDQVPHVLDHIVELWGTPQCREYLDLLLYDNREGKRAGFSSATYGDLVMLRQLLQDAVAPAEQEPGVVDAEDLRPAWAAKPPAPPKVASVTPVPIKKPVPTVTLELEFPFEEEIPKAVAEA